LVPPPPTPCYDKGARFRQGGAPDTFRGRGTGEGGGEEGVGQGMFCKLFYKCHSVNIVKSWLISIRYSSEYQGGGGGI